MLEYVYKTIGEISLHFVVLILTVSFCNYYFETLEAAGSSSSSSNSMVPIPTQHDSASNSFSEL